MSRLKSHKILTTGAIAGLLFCAPMHLAAQEREALTAKQYPALEWLSGLWHAIAIQLTLAPAPQPEPPSQSTPDNGCAIDPNGGCGG
jgi:hypothetical protein